MNYFLLLAGEETELLAARLKVGNFQRCDANPDLYDSNAHAHLSIAVPLKLFHQVTPNCNGKTSTKHIPRRLWETIGVSSLNWIFPGTWVAQSKAVCLWLRS